MLVPLEWMKEYIDLDVDVDEFCEKMIMLGLNVESVDKFGKDMENIIIGRIVKIEKHKNADKLLVCMTDIGEDGPVQIVTGAPNVFEGAIVAVAVHGSRIPGPLHGKPKQEGGAVITKGGIRGIESAGMLCSASELGFSDKVIPIAHREGIWVLNGDLSPGQDIVEALGLVGAAVDFEITPNRPDCLSVTGVAREAGAAFKKKINYPDAVCSGEVENAADYISVEIKKPELCKRYVARVVKDIKIGESPWWLQKRLMLAGMRPINNIVDITNYVMLEYGEPIHAFDIRQIKGGRIVVDTAAEGELFTTLDGKERLLTNDMLLIKDAEKGIAIAGVMGGLNSEIEHDTETIVIEAANFNCDSVRVTSKKTGLRTEASIRFSKGIDEGLCATAADRVCKLIQLVGAGRVIKGAVDVYPVRAGDHTIDVRPDRVACILGTDITRKEITDILTSLEIKVSDGGGVLKVTPPAIRRDLTEEIDIVEEVARVYGYDRLPATIPKGNCEGRKSRERILVDRAKDVMCALGANEIQTYSFVSPRGVDLIGLPEDIRERDFVKIINPLGEENSVMRTLLIPNMLEVLGRNFSRGIQKVRAFELGNTFTDSMTNADGLPDERDSMAIAVYGPGESFFTLKGMIAELLANLGIRAPIFSAESEYGLYHPGRCARIMFGEAEIGIMGEVHPDISDKYGIGTRCCCAELMFDKLIKHANLEKMYKTLPRYPSTSRDIALVVDEDMQTGFIKEIIEGEGGGILENAELFDVYRGKQIEDGKKSVAFALTYRAGDRTLTDDEVSIVHGRIIKMLADKTKAVLRDI